MQESFRKFSQEASVRVGSPWAFSLAALLIVAWIVSGPIFHFSDTWQLVINTTMSIVTFLMVFLIQNTQNRDARAIHLKLDELIKVTAAAKNEFIDAEELSDEQLAGLKQEVERVYHSRRK